MVRNSIWFVVLLLVLSACDSSRRQASDIKTLLVFGDTRPSCTTGEQDPKTPQLFALLQSEAEQRRPDAIVGTGDYICAREWEGDKAVAQFDRFQRQYPVAWFPRTVLASGNHEVGHKQLARYSRFAMETKAWFDLGDLRIVVLPSDMDVSESLSTGWLDRALSHEGRLVVVRHEPWNSCGTRGDWVRARVQVAKPNLVLFGHIHTWAAPGTHLTECGRSVTLGPNELIVGNGGAYGWQDQAGWVGITVVTLQKDGSSDVLGLDVATRGGIQERVHISRPPR